MARIYGRDSNERHTRVTLNVNEYEFDQLTEKAAKCGVTKSEYLRELICSSCPSEAPPPGFYKAYDDINRIGTNLNQIAAVANATGVVDDEDIEYIKQAATEIKKRMSEMKMIVMSPKEYSATYFEALALKEKQAKREGKPVPTDINEIIPKVEKKDEDYPIEDYPFDVYAPYERKKKKEVSQTSNNPRKRVRLVTNGEW